MEAKDFDIDIPGSKGYIKVNRMPDGNFQVKRLEDGIPVGWFRYLQLKNEWFFRYNEGSVFTVSKIDTITPELLEYLIELNRQTANAKP